MHRDIWQGTKSVEPPHRDDPQCDESIQRRKIPQKRPSVGRDFAWDPPFI